MKEDMILMRYVALFVVLICMGCVAVPYHGYDYDYYYPDYTYRYYSDPYSSGPYYYYYP